MERILVGTTATSYKEYVLDRFLDMVNGLTCPDFDFVAVVSQRDVDYGDKIISKLKERGFGHKSKIIVDAWSVEPRIRVTSHHNKLREECIMGNYDRLMIIDQDIIPPDDIVERFVNHDKEIVIGVYKLDFGGDMVNCVWYKRFKLENGRLMANWLENEKLNVGLHRWLGGFATGCVMIKKNALEKIYFRPGNMDNFQDGLLWKDLYYIGIEAYLDTDVMCEHYPSDWKPLFEEAIKAGYNIKLVEGG